MSIRSDYAAKAARAIISDLARWGISQRQAAKRIGIALSTLNAFLNCPYHNNKQQKKTLIKVLGSSLWSQTTYDLLIKLANFDDLAFAGELPLSDKLGSLELQVIDGGRSVAQR